MSRHSWNVIRACFGSITPEQDATPGVGIVVHTYGDFLNFNPHLHAIVPDSCFPESGGFWMVPWLTAQELVVSFRNEVLTMLKKERKITGAVIENMISWHHSGFIVHSGEKPTQRTGRIGKMDGLCQVMDSKKVLISREAAKIAKKNTFILGSYLRAFVSSCENLLFYEIVKGNDQEIVLY